jgi:hypothetical protein
MKRLLAFLGAALVAALPIRPCPAGLVMDFDDITFWTGSGSNRTALVIDWNDGIPSESLAWGYRWEGAAPTVFQMLVGLAGAGSGIHLRIDSATNLGPGIFGLGYQAGATPFGVSGAVDSTGNAAVPVFIGGISDTNTAGTTVQAPLTSTGAGPSNPGDHYKEGWFDNGFWELFDGTAGFALTGNWTSNFVGASTPAVPEGWFAFSITEPDYDSVLPGQPLAAVPEPSVALLAALGLLAVAGRRARPQP